MPFKTCSLAICVLVLFVAVNDFCSAQGRTIANQSNNLTARQLGKVHIEQQSLASLLSDLSLSYEIPIGLELAVNDDELAVHKIDFSGGSLSDLLTQFVAQHSQYTWEIKDGVVNIFPKDKYRDLILDELLSAKIGAFSIKANTSCWDLQKSLTSTPEIRRIREVYGIAPSGFNFTGLYFPQLGRDFTLDVSNMTVKSILNKVVKDSPTARYWVIKRHTDDQTFFIRLGARHEDSSLLKQN